MEISTLPLTSSFSFTKPPNPSLSFSSSNSSFFNPTHLTKPRKISVSLAKTTTRKSKGLSCTCLFGLGVPEIVVIAGVVALVFGPKKLPEVGKSIGKTVKSFQQAAKEFEAEIKKEPEPLSESPPMEKPAVASTAEKQDDKVSSSKEI